MIPSITSSQRAFPVHPGWSVFKYNRRLWCCHCIVPFETKLTETEGIGRRNVFRRRKVQLLAAPPPPTRPSRGFCSLPTGGPQTIPPPAACPPPTNITVSPRFLSMPFFYLTSIALPERSAPFLTHQLSRSIPDSLGPDSSKHPATPVILMEGLLVPQACQRQTSAFPPASWPSPPLTKDPHLPPCGVFFLLIPSATKICHSSTS